MLSKIACLILGICFLLPVFPSAPQIKASAATEGAVTEIISTDRDKMTESLRAAATSCTPFDENTRQPMPGYSITPAADEHSQVSAAYVVNPFEIDSSTSVYMWIYFPDNPLSILYSLKIGFYSYGNQFVSWEFDPQKLYDLMASPFHEKYGWKKLELVYLDATEGQNLIGAQFQRMEISYKLAEELPNYPSTSDTISIYGAYAAEKSSDTTSVIENTSYYHYSFSSDFSASLNSLSPGDNIQLKTIGGTFRYLYVGKNNLLTSGSQNNKFVWSISVSFKGEVFSQPEFGGGTNSFIFFKDAGNYKISFKLEEQRNIDSKVEVFVAIKDVQVSGFRFGVFSSRSYELERKTTQVLTFELEDGFEVDPQKFSFYVSNDKVASIASVEYNAEQNVFYITVNALKSGETDITAEVSAEYKGKQQTFSQTTTVTVSHSGINSWMLYTLYATLAAGGLAFVIFLVISFVNARKNSVK